MDKFVERVYSFTYIYAKKLMSLNLELKGGEETPTPTAIQDIVLEKIKFQQS